MKRGPNPSEPIVASRAFPERLLRAHAHDEARAFVAAVDMAPATRRKLWRAWCAATMSSVRREGLEIVAPSRTREQQLALEF